MTFGTLLRKLRIEKGISQSEIAHNIGLDQSTYSRIESDMVEPKANMLLHLAKYYQIEITKLYPPHYKRLTISYLCELFKLFGQAINLLETTCKTKVVGSLLSITGWLGH
jgi:transcriptional regulator with XRE-family HTH domain